MLKAQIVDFSKVKCVAAIHIAECDKTSTYVPKSFKLLTAHRKSQFI